MPGCCNTQICAYADAVVPTVFAFFVWQISGPINTTGLVEYPPGMPNPLTNADGLIIRGNVFVNWKADPKYKMGMGNGACVGTLLPCNTSGVSIAKLC